MKRNTHLEMVAELLGTDPIGFARNHRSEGLTYQQIARELYTATNGKVDVSFSTIRNWLTVQPEDAA